MIRLGSLLDRDLSRPIPGTVKIDNADPDTAFTELTEYVATDRLKAEYESVFSAMAAAPRSPSEAVGVWISGFVGSGKTSFAKILGYVLANRPVRNVPSSALFLQQVGSPRVAECVEFLNRSVPCEVFLLDARTDLPAGTGTEQIAEAMYRVVLRELDYADDSNIAELEIALEKQGKLSALQDLCLAEHHEEWRKIRAGSQNHERSSALLHLLDGQAYPSADTWLSRVKAQPPHGRNITELVERVFDLCEIRRSGKTFAFVVDDIGDYLAAGGGRIEEFRFFVEQFGKQSRSRVRAGKIPGPAWFVATAQKKLEDYIGPAASQEHFKLQIDLSSAGIGDVVARRVLRKKPGEEPNLRTLFRDCGAALTQNVKLEMSSRGIGLDEDSFVRSYPYLPHLIDLSIEIAAGIQSHSDAPKQVAGGKLAIVRQAFDMLASERIGLADQPFGVLVSLDKIYDLLEDTLPPRKRRDLLDISQRFDDDKDYPGTASRVAKAICLMESVRMDLPRTTKNIAALLVQRVTEAPPVLAVAAVLYRMEQARFFRWTEEGWELFDLDKLRRAVACLEGLKNAVGVVNPRRPGWHNDLIQFVKKSFARALEWYTRPLYEFNSAVSRALDEMAWALNRVAADQMPPEYHSRNAVALERFSAGLVALEQRLALSERRNAILANSMEAQIDVLHEHVKEVARIQKSLFPEAFAGGIETDWEKRASENSRFYAPAGPGNYKTAYVIGLFGTGRRYVNELILENIGERAQYFRDTLRFHPGPTPMIYSGHATMKYVSRGQEPPAVMHRILEAVQSDFANAIFIYRHPIDSLLTNWIWWRAFLRGRSIEGISQVYQSTGELCADVERNFFELKAFAEGDPDFFAGASGPRFLSFPEFVEETELHRESASLTLRLEDFIAAPLLEFRKLAQVLSPNFDPTGHSVAPPKTKAYGYLAVKDNVPRFRKLIDSMDAETRMRIERIGYRI